MESEAVNILIAPDKFKGTLTGIEAARCMRSGWRKRRPKDKLRLLPICDGGDGFGEALANLEGAHKMSCQTMDAAHRPIRTHWWWQPEKRMAIIETALVIGLAQLPKGRYHPFDLDTFGLGKMLLQAAAKGARTCVIGIGGSATNDGGFGMARALGWRFLDAEGKEILEWPQLTALTNLQRPSKRKLFPNLIIASDVTNILLGTEGASRIYGPQKGLRAKDMARSEACLKQLAIHVDPRQGKPYQTMPGTGAAGGLGYGLMAFLSGKAQSGFDYFCKRSKLEHHIDWADLVLTGEGSLDKSSLMGKGVGGVALKCQERNTPCIGLGGMIKHKKIINQLFQNTYAIAPELTDAENAQANAAKWLTLLATKASSDIQL